MIHFSSAGALSTPIVTMCGAALLAFGAHGCASHDDAVHERVGRAHLPIIHGTPSPAEQDAVVALAVTAQGQSYPHCSATLIARNVVLTARHCVGELDEKGNVTNFPATMLSVFVGVDGTSRAKRNLPPDGKGMRIFSTGTFLVPDVAILVLQSEIAEAKYAPIRLAGGAKKGEGLVVIGFGIDESGDQPASRRQRTGVSVTKVGPAMTTVGEIYAGEFAFGEAACSGDSGGPAISATSKAVVGVASRVSNGSGHNTANPADFCIGANTEDVYSSLDQVTELVKAAFAAAGSKPLLEGETPEPEKPPEPEAPKPKSPAPAEEAPAVAPKTTTTTTTTSGCSASPASSANASLLGMVGALAFVLVRRRRRA